jgi:hypothetical protein
MGRSWRKWAVKSPLTLKLWRDRQLADTIGRRNDLPVKFTPQQLARLLILAAVVIWSVVLGVALWATPPASVEGLLPLDDFDALVLDDGTVIFVLNPTGDTGASRQAILDAAEALR